MKKAKWMKSLNREEINHLIETTFNCTKISFLKNLEHQRIQNMKCFTCESIARKINKGAIT